MESELSPWPNDVTVPCSDWIFERWKHVKDNAVLIVSLQELSFDTQRIAY